MKLINLLTIKPLAQLNKRALILAAFTFLSSQQVSANTEQTNTQVLTKLSTSVGNKKLSDDSAQLNDTLTSEQRSDENSLDPTKENKLTPTTTLSSKLLNRATGESRAQRLAAKRATISKQTTNKMPPSLSSFHSFAIYDATTLLIEDLDLDGYYQTFSISFDADVLTSGFNEYATVYAELYLSRNNEDWFHYYSTDNFVIYGESSDDIYEVYTTLEQGYLAGEYDVLIDLYEVGVEEPVATISAIELDSLYALPLESSDYDPEYIEYESHSHGHGGGSFSFLLCCLTALSLYRTKLIPNETNKK